MNAKSGLQKNPDCDTNEGRKNKRNSKTPV
jgi:hypothetical protein